MNFIHDAMMKVSSNAGCELKLLNESDVVEIRKCVKIKYAEFGSHLPLWERLQNDTSRHEPTGWMIIGQFQTKGPVIIFLDEANESRMYY